MRLLWLLCAAAVGVIAFSEEEEKLIGILKSWSQEKPIEEVEHWVSKKKENEPQEHLFQDVENHGRSKRSIPFLGNAAAQVIAPHSYCQVPGYTGQFCNNPICEATNEFVVEHEATDGEGALIDTAYLGNNCSMQYATIVDDTMYWITVSIVADGDVYPNFYLIDETGFTHFVDETVSRTPNSYTGRYSTLPPGNYYIKPSANVYNKACLTMIKARTRVVVEGGWIQGDAVATERRDFPNQHYTYQNSLNTFVVHASHMRSPGSLVAVSIFEGNKIVSRPKMLGTRYNCSYEYYYESFYCRNTGDYYYQVEGITFRGYPFRRTNVMTCIVNPNPPTYQPPVTTPRPTNPTDCGRGTLVKNFDNTTYCICPDLWGGYMCDQLECMNGGTPGSLKCACPSGFEGTHCQDVICADRGSNNFEVDEPSMIFTIRLRTQMKDVIAQVITAVATYTNEISTYDPNYVKKFGLILFNNAVFAPPPIYFDSPVRMLEHLQRAANNTQDSSGGCQDTDFAAIAYALQSIEVSPRSILYHITDSMPNDYAQDLETVFHLDSYWRVPLYFIYVAPTPGSGCTPSELDPGFRAMDDITTRTMGLALYVRDRTGIQDLLLKHMQGLFYRSQLMLINDLAVCGSQNTFNSFAVDTLADQIVIVAKGVNLTLSTGSLPTVSVKFDVQYQGNNFYIWKASGVPIGQYWLNVITTEPVSSCNYRVYQKSFHTQMLAGQQLELFWTFTDSILDNGRMQQPVMNFDVGIAMHLKHYPEFIPPERVSAELLIFASRQGRQEPIYMSNGMWRDGCDYQFYFPPFTCTTARETLHFQFFAKDQNGYMIQRAGSIYCSEFHPTFTPPNECQHGGVVDPNNNGTCFCPPGYTGDKCQQIVCWNGGTPTSGFCTCPPGFLGAHCEMVSCNGGKGFVPDDDFFVDMAFAVEMTEQARPQLTALNSKFAEIIRDVQNQHPFWIRRFVLIGFNTTWGGIVKRVDTGDADQIITVMNTLATGPLDQANCTKVLMWHGLSESLRDRLGARSLARGSFISVFTTNAPAEQGYVRDIIEMYEAAREKRIQLTAVTQGPFPCGNTWSDYQVLHDACRFSNGESYRLGASQVSNFGQFIVEKFMQSTIVHRRFTDCTEALSVPIPVDAYAQTLLILVEGYNANVSLYSPRGNLVPAPYFSPFIADSANNQQFFELRRECDGAWELDGNYCYIAGLDTVDWTTAKAICHANGGFLADDLSQAKHDFINAYGMGFKLWLGLNRLNSTQGWQWDRYGSEQKMTSPTFWYQNQDPTDPTQQCAYINTDPSDKTWHAEDCKQKYNYLCEKHAYNFDNPPARMDDDVLPPGKWSLRVQTAAPPAGQNPQCFVEVRTQSLLRVISAYSEDIHSDFPLADPIAHSTKNHIVSTVKSHADYRNREPFLTHGLIFSAHNDTMWDAVTFAPRGICAWDHISQDFSCPDSDNPDNLFTVLHLGEDEFGHTFQRVMNGHCQKPMYTCGNGGLRYNGSCVCTEYWQGQDCMTPNCVNGGQLDEDDRRCVCPPGFGGYACQLEMCTVRQNHTINHDPKTLIVLLEESQQNLPAMQQLAAGFTSIVQNLQSGWFGSYVLITFNSQGVKFAQLPTADPAKIVSAINERIPLATDTSKCSMPLYGAMGSTFDLVQGTIEAQVLLVTSSEASDLATRMPVVEKITTLSPRLHYIYTSTAGCTYNASVPNSGGIQHFLRFAYATGGSGIFIAQTDVTTALQAYVPAQYHAYPMLYPTFTDSQCTSETWYLQVDNNSSDIYVAAVSDIGMLSAVNPFGDSIPVNPMFTSGKTTYYHLKPQYGGIHVLNYASPGPCYVSVLGQGGPRVFTGFVQPTSADPTGAHTDIITTDALLGTNAPVVHLEMPMRERSHLRYIEMWDPQNNRGYRSELFRRENCFMEYYADPFQCNQTEFFLMVISGFDELYQPFERLAVSFCLTGNQTLPTGGPPTPPITQGPPVTGQVTTTTTIPPTTSYGLPNIMVDIYFAIDVTSTAKNNIDEMIQFVKTLLLPFTVGQSYARVGFIPVMSIGAFVTAPLSASSGTNSVFTALGALKTTYQDFDETGPILGADLDYLLKPEYLTNQAGYRANLKNHVVIYLTSSTTISDLDDAVRNANLMRSMGDYGQIAIAYKTGGTGAADLKKVVGPSNSATCVFTAEDEHSLNTDVAKKVQQLIFDNDQSGIYCKN